MFKRICSRSVTSMFWIGAGVVISSLGGLASPAMAQTVVKTPEYLANGWQYDAIGLDQALIKQLYGNGVTVGIVDSAMQAGNSEFAGRLAPYQSNSFPAGRGHGTNVGSVVGGAIDGVGMHGVASRALLSSIRAISENDPPVAPDPPPANSISTGYDGAIAAGIRIFNNSYGQDVELAGMTADAAIAQFNGSGELDAYRRAVEAGAVLVFAAGNKETPNPGGEPALPAIFPELRKGWIAVGALDRGEDGSLIHSNGTANCGNSAQWCMVAPGVDVRMADPSGYINASGTSYSSPMVAGALAIARQMFPNTSYQSLRDLVLRTSRDIGAPGVDPVFGWGLLSIANLVSTTDPANGAVVSNTTTGQTGTVNNVLSVVGNRAATVRGDTTAPSEATASVTAPEPTTNVADLMAETRMSLGGPVSREQGERILASRPGSQAGAQAWGRALGGETSIDATAGAPGATVDTVGGIGGYDVAVNRAWRVGAALGYTSSELGSDSTRDTSEARGVHGLLYASWYSGGWFAEQIADVTWFDTTYRRGTILGLVGAVGAGQVGTTQADAVAFASRTKAGHVFKVAGSSFEPYVQLNWIHMHTDGAVEQGPGVFALTLQASDFDQVEGGAGLRSRFAPVTAAGVVIVPVIDVSYSARGGDRAVVNTVTMLGTPISSSTAQIGNDVVSVGAELEFAVPGSTMSGFVGYNGTFQENVSDQSVSGGVTVQF